MPWYDLLLTLVDFRSFSNLWYWLALAVTWSVASYRILGVPFDVIERAGQGGDQARIDLGDYLRLTCGRLLEIEGRAGPWIVGFYGFGFTSLAMLAVGYGVEFAQALLLLFGPFVLVSVINLRLARRIMSGEMTFEEVVPALRNHRRKVQVIGMLSILVTVFFGMAHNLNIGMWG